MWVGEQSRDATRRVLMCSRHHIPMERGRHGIKRCPRCVARACEIVSKARPSAGAHAGLKQGVKP